MNIRLLLGTFFGVGHLPVAPGTWGSFFTLPLVYLTVYYFPAFGITVFVVIACILSLICAREAQIEYGDDPSQFVLDEVAGQSLVFLFTGFIHSFSYDTTLLATGFFLFRIFDIAKPLGINKLQKLPGEIGILVDDLLAGVYALICLKLLEHSLFTLL